MFSTPGKFGPPQKVFDGEGFALDRVAQPSPFNCDPVLNQQGEQLLQVPADLDIRVGFLVELSIQTNRI